MISVLFLIPVFAQEEFGGETGEGLDNVKGDLLDSIRIETIVAIAAVITALIVAVITWHYQRKNLEFNALLHIHELLNSDDNRIARRKVIERWNNYIPEKIITEPEFQDLGKKVMNDWDEIGILIYRKIDLKTKQPSRFGGYVPKDVFLTGYSGAVVNSWIVLNDLRIKLSAEWGSTHFKIYFEKLYEDAIEFRKKNGSGESAIQKKAKERQKEKTKSQNTSSEDKNQQDSVQQS